MPEDNHTVPQKTWTLKAVLEVLESEGKVKLWNLKTGEILNFEHERAAVAFTSGGNNVLARDSNGRIQTFDSAGKHLGEVKLRLEQ